nr:MAG TPA: hypothetical protein [Caudoviricetes sp.]
MLKAFKLLLTLGVCGGCYSLAYYNNQPFLYFLSFVAFVTFFNQLQS